MYTTMSQLLKVERRLSHASNHSTRNTSSWRQRERLFRKSWLTGASLPSSEGERIEAPHARALHFGPKKLMEDAGADWRILASSAGYTAFDPVLENM